MTLVLAAVRCVHWTACLLFAALPFHRAWILPAVRPDAPCQKAGFSARLAALERAVWAAALLSLVPWFVLTAWGMAGLDAALDPSSLLVVATRTQFGRICAARSVLLTLAGLRLFALPHRVPATGTGALASVILLTLALTGHAAAAPGPVAALHLATDALHLAAAAVWPAGLVPFAMLLRSQPATRAVADGARRFSTASLAAVATLAGTGLALSFTFLHRLNDLWTTDYGRLLAVKAFLFASMVAVGAWNLLVLRRKLAQEAGTAVAGRPTPAIRALLRNVWREILLGAAVLLIVALLGLTAPPEV